MSKYFCNPLNVSYRYQFVRDPMNNRITAAREAADPSLIYFKGKYYIFASMTLEVWESTDLVTWIPHRLPDNLPLYDYAPDVTAAGEYVYFCASKSSEICNYYRTKDVINGPYEEIKGSFEFWDPNLFLDDDGRLYFYWGCGSMTPIWGTELDPETLHPLGQKAELISGDAFKKGYERIGKNHSLLPLSDGEIEEKYQEFLREKGVKKEQIPPEAETAIKGLFAQKPFIEGAWMNKYQGKYYLQYACPGTEYNVYGDGVYVSENPLGPFRPARNNPYSYKPGGFCPGAGHGSTIWDQNKNLWHTATMSISVNHKFERRIGLWPAGFDEEGEMFCNQRYGDWPYEVSGCHTDPWKDPAWFLMSYKKPVSTSSFVKGNEAEKVTDENIQTWWMAAERDGQWLEMDLEKVSDVRAIQVNFAEDIQNIPVPESKLGLKTDRYIEENILPLRWKLKGSRDGNEYFMIEDKSCSMDCLPHDLIVRENGVSVRYLRLEFIEMPYRQRPCISGLRVFGIGTGDKPDKPTFTAKRISDLDMEVVIEGKAAAGYNILWGHDKDKLYHSYMTFDNIQKAGALVKGQEYFIRVDAFNENGITKGDVVPLEK